MQTPRQSGLISARLAGVVLGLFLCAPPLFEAPGLYAQSDDVAEYQVKLAVLYHFAQFVQWPPEAFSSPTAPITICVAGPDPFKGDLERGLAGRTAAGHPIQIKRLKPDDDPKVCQIVFVRSTEKKTTGKILSGLKGSNTLTVGESNGFASEGGLVNLTLSENKLRFEINLDAAMQTRLKISSKLLALAKIVKMQ
jgi:hypothetical protein